MYAALSEQQKQEVIEGLAVELLRYGVQYRNLSVGEGNTTIYEFITITNETSEDEFGRRVFLVISAAKLHLLEMSRRVSMLSTSGTALPQPAQGAR